MMTEEFWLYFHELYESIPRQGPGTQESTERAFRLLPGMGRRCRILDVGCGSGTQTLDLARIADADITAVDLHPAYVAQLQERSLNETLKGNITATQGDMCALPFPDASFDLIWCEGAIFIIGFSEGLGKWRRMLTPGGHLVVSEFCWFSDDPPAELQEMFLDGNTDAQQREARRADIAANGYRLLHEFVLPAEGWWNNYYLPLSESLELFEEKYAQNPEALAVARRSRREIELYRKHSNHYGYVFFVMERMDDR